MAGYGQGVLRGRCVQLLVVLLELVVDRDVADGAGVGAVGVTTASGSVLRNTWTFTWMLVTSWPVASLKLTPLGASRVTGKIWSALSP